MRYVLARSYTDTDSLYLRALLVCAEMERGLSSQPSFCKPNLDLNGSLLR